MTEDQQKKQTENRREIPRAVILDLLPLYLCGELSDESKRLVDAHLVRDPELAARVRAGAVALPQIGTAPDLELRALGHTRSLLSRQRWLMGAALFCTMTPLLVVVGHDGVVRWAWTRAPYVASALELAAFVLWMFYARTRRRLRGSGV